MSTTDNGWFASPSLALRPFVIDGVPFVPGIVDDDDVAFVLGYVMQQVADRVEPPEAGWCWGFAFRDNVNEPNSLSRHSGGIAVDFNAPDHPNGVPASFSFSPVQIAEIHQILGEVEDAVRWGGDYNGTPDAMHFEIDVTPAELPAVAARLRNRLEANMPLNDPDKAEVRRIIREELDEFAKRAGDLIKIDHDGNAKTAKWSLSRVLAWIKR